jgi:DNA-directed RNA polymerase subunit RPC12/RpoP
MASIKPTVQDKRAVLKSIYREQMQKDQKKEMEKMLEKGGQQAYGGNCPYCSKFVILNDQLAETKKAHEEEIRDQKYVVEPCPYCRKEIFVHLVIKPPEDFLGKPTIIGMFEPKEKVYKKEEYPKATPYTKPMEELPPVPTHKDIEEVMQRKEINPAGAPVRGLTLMDLYRLQNQAKPRKKQIKLE